MPERIDKTLPGCACPPGEHLVAVACPVHFGDGYGECIPHDVDRNELIAATGYCCEVGLCASCLSAHDNSMKRHGKEHRGQRHG